MKDTSIAAKLVAEITPAQRAKMERVETLIQLHQQLASDVDEVKATLTSILQPRIDRLNVCGIDTSQLVSMQDSIVEAISQTMASVKIAQAKEFE